MELRRRREAARLTQRQLAQRIRYSDSMVNMVEKAKRSPSKPFAEKCDQVFGLDGTMTKLQADTGWKKAPEYLRSWLEEEQDADCLRAWQPAIVPGLLQTEAYAREILAATPGIIEEELEKRLANRMQRQAILYRDEPPVLNVVMDEAVLYRVIGDIEVMQEQLRHLLEVARHPRVAIQIVPRTVRAHCGMAGGFIIAERNGAPYAAYTDAQPFGRTFSDRRLIAELVRLYDALRAESVPFSQSLLLIEEAVKQLAAKSSQSTLA
ncbi:helix-turn-helix domain-containing protein [Sphaerisporangium fuscum]|uniref:helix-turn-helix domain-containing protein n=1 Tax=Sphaerisporangium fuscum TaxID=2835868 RepID=UPI001BDDC7F6|nr:helix-turn-helix transcriptional regulator [Sphaerisporangium fuscum]